MKLFSIDEFMTALVPEAYGYGIACETKEEVYKCVDNLKGFVGSRCDFKINEADIYRAMEQYGNYDDGLIMFYHAPTNTVCTTALNHSEECDVEFSSLIWPMEQTEINANVSDLMSLL